MSSGYVPLEEYRQIKASWRAAAMDQDGKRGRWFDYGTPMENLDRCHMNLRQLAREEVELRDLHERLPPGDNRRLAHKNGEEEIPALKDRIRKNRAEQIHWRNYVDYYQRLAVKEPPPARAAAPPPAPQQDRRLPREPGDDDDAVGTTP